MVLTAMTASLSAMIEFKTEGNLGNKQKKRKKFFLLAIFRHFGGSNRPFLTHIRHFSFSTEISFLSR